MQNVFLKTEIVTLKYITQDDFEELKTILKDKDVQEWINRNFDFYKRYNLGFFLMSENQLGNVIGLTALKPDTIEGKQYYEIGYILKNDYWHKGYATENAKALKEYAFNILKLMRLFLKFVQIISHHAGLLKI